MSKAKVGADVTLGLALGVIAQAVLNSWGVELDDSLIPAIGSVVLILAGRVGFRLKPKKDNFRSNKNPKGDLP